MTHKIYFSPLQYEKEFNLITVEMTRDFYIANVKHKLSNGQYCIQEVEVVSQATGKSKIFKIQGEHASGIRYKSGNIQLNLISSKLFN